MSVSRIPLIDELSRTDREIDAIQKETDPEKRKILLNDFLVAHDRLFVRIGKSHSRKYNVLSANDIDDIIQVVRDVARGIIESNSYIPYSRITFEVQLSSVSHTATQTYIRRSEFSNLSGDGPARRRVVEWRSIVEELTQMLQRSPTRDEIEQRYRELYKVTPDGEIDYSIKAGMIEYHNVRLLDSRVWWEPEIGVDNSEDSPEHLVVGEAADIIEQLIQECAAVSSELEAYARKWIEAVIAGESHTDLYKVFGYTPSKGYRLERALKNVMREYLIEH
jgi:hypothetical protein